MMIIKFGHSDPWSRNKWEMTINLAELVKGELKMPQVRKIFKLMIQNAESEEIEQVQNYLNSSSKKYAAVFKEIKQKGR
jgi:hypothetical protein